ncbi:MAG TPA: VWA domain-containing protein [Bryobacteraceae bacterium]|nr:VWA domain-containing protein [Bryobacteraceae bacterium]
MIRAAAILSICAILFCGPAIPQDQPNAKIQVNVNEVIVPVTVTDMKGRFVSNLEAKDFRVLDEGKPQRIEFFSHSEKQPIVVGFLLDMSNNTRIHWKRYQESVMELVWNLLPGDPRYSGYLVSYGNSAELLVNTTTDSDKIAEQIRRMKPGGGAALYDAIYQACTKREVVRGEPYEPRRVIIVVGDGHDNASGKTLDEVIEIAQRNLVTIYGMSTQAYGFDVPEGDVLERLAEETGGHVEYPLNTIFKDTAVGTYFCNPSDEGCYAYKVGTGGYEAAISGSIIKAVGAISGDVTTQYVLRYIPQTDPDDKGKVYRKIKVEVNLPDIIIRARHGYYPAALPNEHP